MSPEYNAPFMLNQEITENLSDAQTNGNLGVLAAGPISTPLQLSATGMQYPFSLVLPAYNVVNYATVYSGGSDRVTNNINFEVFSGNPFLGIEGTPAPAPDGSILPVSIGGQGNIAGTYNNGVGGVGATFTVSPGVLPLKYDNGNSASNFDVVLLGGQTNTFQNGIYSYDLSTGILTRSTSFNTPAQWPKGLFLYPVFSTSGGPGNVWMNSPSVTTLGTDPITFIRPSISSAGYPGSAVTLSILSNYSGFVANYDINDIKVVPEAGEGAGLPSFYPGEVTTHLNYQPFD